MSLLQRLTSKLERAKGRRDQVNTSLKADRDKHRQLSTLLERQSEARVVLQKVAQQTQNQLVFRISELVELCINSIFDTEYKFILNFIQKRNKTEAEIYIEDEQGRYEISPADGMGNIVAFALRIVLWDLYKPKSCSTIVLDEPFKDLSQDKQERVGMLLKMLSQQLGLQFIIVTHKSDIKKNADKVFNVKKIKEVSVVRT